MQLLSAQVQIIQVNCGLHSISFAYHACGAFRKLWGLLNNDRRACG